MKSLAQRSSQTFLATLGSVGVPDYCANVELLDLGYFLDGKVAFVRGERTRTTPSSSLATMRLTTSTAQVTR